MSIYTPGERGTIRSTSKYNVQEACVKLYEAMKGLGTDEEAVIDVIVGHTFEERQAMKKKYKTMYNKDLIKELDSEVSFAFGKLVLALFVDPEEFLMECIHHAVSPASRSGKLFKRLSSLFKEGLSGNEFLIIGILCSRPNKELKLIKKTYKKVTGEKLDEKILAGGNNMSQDVCSFILDMISANREEEDEVDLEVLQEDLEELGAATNEEVLHTILQERSFVHLRSLFKECKSMNKKTVEEIIEELEGITVELKEAYKAFVTLIRDGEAAYYADRVKGAIEGAGTDDDTLIKVLVMRAEIDLADIMECYEKKYKVEMAQEVADDCSGDYKELILRILTKPPKLPKEKKGKEEIVDEEAEAVVEEEVIEKKKTVVAEKAPKKQKEAPKKVKEVPVEKEETVEVEEIPAIEETAVEVVEPEKESEPEPEEDEKTINADEEPEKEAPAEEEDVKTDEQDEAKEEGDESAEPPVEEDPQPEEEITTEENENAADEDEKKTAEVITDDTGTKGSKSEEGQDAEEELDETGSPILREL